MDVDQDKMSASVESCDVTEKESCSSFKTSPENDGEDSGSSHCSLTSRDAPSLLHIPLNQSKTDLEENQGSFHDVFDTSEKSEVLEQNQADMQEVIDKLELIKEAVVASTVLPLDVVGDNIISISKMCMENKTDYVVMPPGVPKTEMPKEIPDVDVNGSGETTEKKADSDVEDAEEQSGGNDKQESLDACVEPEVQPEVQAEVQAEGNEEGAVFTLMKPKAQSVGTVLEEDAGRRLSPKRASPIYIISNFVGGRIDLGESAEHFEDLIYWRDRSKTATVFFGVLCLLLSMQYYSLISVMSYVSLGFLGCGFFCRLYSTSHGGSENPILDFSPALGEENVQRITDTAAYFIVDSVMALRHLYLVDELGDSIKFALVLWYLTYVGCWFNGMTIVTISFVTIFTLPNIYERNKEGIDRWLFAWWDKWLDLTARARNASEESIVRILSAGRQGIMQGAIGKEHGHTAN